MRLLAVVAAVAVLLAGCGGDDDENAQPPASGDEQCADVASPEPRAPERRAKPNEPLAPDTTHTLTFETSCGSFTVTLDTGLAPNTAASLVALAEDGYFDDTIFHRVVPGFVVQGGDPTQTGAGGPGYSTVDPPPRDAAYTKGVVAMAKTETEPAGTAGSQFFVVTGADAMLPPLYAIVGTVRSGIDTIERIDALGVSNGPPAIPVVVESVTVGEE